MDSEKNTMAKRNRVRKKKKKKTQRKKKIEQEIICSGRLPEDMIHQILSFFPTLQSSEYSLNLVKEKRIRERPRPWLNIIINGSLETMKKLECPNLLIDNFDRTTGIKTGQLTPLAMVINQNRRDVQDRVDVLIEAGADPELQFTFNKRITTAREIALKYRSHIIFS